MVAVSRKLGKPVLVAVLLASGCAGAGQPQATPTSPECPSPVPAGDVTPSPLPPECVVPAETAEPTPPLEGQEVWEGTISSEVFTVGGPPGPCGSPTTVEGTVRLIVEPDGSLTGTYDVSGCGVTEPHARFTGTETEDGFTFPELIVFTNGELVPKVSSTKAEARLTNCQCAGGGGARYVTTWDLTCTTC
jgi:hypothetical protein